ncbi:MAG: VCBS repeat-containing protein, partial [Phycisphaerales bacterium]|nr:VCBS repeat-containing protein [Phycisphaerales bacterium]
MTTRPSAFPIRRPFLPLAIAVAPLVASSPAGANDFCFFATPYEVQNSPSCVVQADFNGDSRLDLVVANHEVGQDTISVLINNGDGTFAAAVNYPVLGRPYWLGTGDLDGDLDADVVVSNYFGHTVSVLLNDGSGALGAATDYPVGFFPTILALARLDGDDSLDIAVASAADATVAVLLNNGDGTYLPPAFHPVGINPYGVTADDFDGDGFVDLAVANYDPAIPSISVLHNIGDGTFADQVLVPVADAPVGIASADLDGDGRPELVVT